MTHVGEEERLHLAGFLSILSLLLVFLQLLVGYIQLLLCEQQAPISVCKFLKQYLFLVFFHYDSSKTHIRGKDTNKK